jgi:hypothetical protein
VDALERARQRITVMTDARDALLDHWRWGADPEPAFELLADGVLPEIQLAEEGAFSGARTDRLDRHALRWCAEQAAARAPRSEVERRALLAERLRLLSIGRSPLRVVDQSGAIAAAHLWLLGTLAREVGAEWVSWPGPQPTYRDMDVPENTPELLDWLDQLAALTLRLLTSRLEFQPSARPLVALLDAAAWRGATASGGP